MAVVEIRKPFEVFNDVDGKPLDSGYVYIGVSGSEPQSTPKAVFWDAGLTIPAVQPLRTQNGFIVNNGAPAAFYTDGSYSIKTVDYSGVTIALRLVNSDGAVTLGSLATKNEGTGGVDFRNNADNDARFLLRSEYSPSSSGGSNQFKIINGDFAVNQGGGGGGIAFPAATPATPSLSTGASGADRWFPVYFSSVGSATFSLVSGGSGVGHLSPQSVYSLTSSGQVASNTFVLFIQRIESARTYAGQTVTFFNWMKRATAGNVAFSIRQNFGTGGSPSADVTTYVGQSAITTAFAPYRFVANIPSVAGKTFGSNNNDYLEIAYWLSAGSVYNSLTGSLGPQNTTVDFYGIHDRPGDQPIDVINFYQPPDPQQELARCQRYFEVMTNCMRVSSAAPLTGQATFAVQKRDVPTLSNIVLSAGTGVTLNASKTNVTQTGFNGSNANMNSLWASAEL